MIKKGRGTLYKKYVLFLLLGFLFLTSCQKETQEASLDTSNGPVATEDTMTVEEKELKMIQSAIADYNEDRILEQEDTLKTSITKLPVEITSLPEISQLSDLTPVEDSDLQSNTAYVGKYTVNDKYDVTFKIYHPTGGNFWLNGEVLFEIDPSKVTVNDPQYENYRNILNPLLENERKVINYLYGLDVNLSGEPTLDGQYYEVLGFDGADIHSIDDLKAFAQTVFTADYLQQYFYKNAFEGEFPIYKELDGKLYCLPTEITPLNLNQYDIGYIIAVRETEDRVTINLLTSVMNQVQPEVKEIHLLPTAEGYRLVAAV